MGGWRKHWQVDVWKIKKGEFNSKGQPKGEPGSDWNFRIPYGQGGYIKTSPKPKATPRSLSVARTPSTSTQSSDTRTPSSELIALLVEETIGETEPLRMRRMSSASNPDDLYIPSGTLRAFIMDYVMPTKAEVCLHVADQTVRRRNMEQRERRNGPD